MPGSLLPSHRNRLPQPIANYAVEDFPSFEGVLNQLEEDWQELKDQEAVLQRVVSGSRGDPRAARNQLHQQRVALYR